MSAIGSRMEFAFHITLIASVLFNSLLPSTSALARSFPGSNNNSRNHSLFDFLFDRSYQVIFSTSAERVSVNGGTSHGHLLPKNRIMITELGRLS